ncbi:MAG TPA: carboxylating nicotinate-nucleotide diphosphorylase [Chloroflexia bacterium]|nr:carboxylating nicotinate-nucleotide diphosphorylase [Chloroflexia bacterium]
MTQGQLQRLAEAALEEDLAWGDLSSDYFVPANLQARGAFVARKAGVLAGLEVAAAVYQATDSKVSFRPMAQDGAVLQAGQTIAVVEGPARSVLRGERVALNFLQRLSGVASLTARYVQTVQGTKARIVDTRKTTPLLRDLEKYAVRCGGGFNHRRNLSDGVMLKDNHLSALASAGISLEDALQQGREGLPHLVKIEVEVDRLDQIPAALAGGADVILLDNMGPDLLRQAVELIGGKALTEASGGVNLETVRAIAESGVDMISVGALTHSAQALDIGLDFEFRAPNLV